MSRTQQVEICDMEATILPTTREEYNARGASHTLSLARGDFEEEDVEKPILRAPR